MECRRCPFPFRPRELWGSGIIDELKDYEKKSDWFADILKRWKEDKMKRHPKYCPRFPSANVQMYGHGGLCKNRNALKSCMNEGLFICDPDLVEFCPIPSKQEPIKIDILEKISKCGKDRYEVTSEEAQDIVGRGNNRKWVNCSNLPKECMKIPRILGSYGGVLVTEKPPIKTTTRFEKVGDGLVEIFKPTTDFDERSLRHRIGGILKKAGFKDEEIEE